MVAIAKTALSKVFTKAEALEGRSCRAEVVGQKAEGLDPPFPFLLLGVCAPAKAALGGQQLRAGLQTPATDPSACMRTQECPLRLLPSAFVQVFTIS